MNALTQTSLGVVTASPLGFGVLFALQRNWFAASVCVVYVIAVIAVVTVMISRKGKSGSLEESAAESAPKPMTFSAALGHIGMAGLIVAAFIATAVTGEWLWAGMASGSILASLFILVSRRKRGTSVTSRDLVDTFL